MNDAAAFLKTIREKQPKETAENIQWLIDKTNHIKNLLDKGELKLTDSNEFNHYVWLAVKDICDAIKVIEE